MTEVLSGIEGGPTQPLPEDTAAAAAEFFARLARHGLIEFLPDDKARNTWPERFLETMETVRLSSEPTCPTTRRWLSGWQTTGANSRPSSSKGRDRSA